MATRSPNAGDRTQNGSPQFVIGAPSDRFAELVRRRAAAATPDRPVWWLVHTPAAAREARRALVGGGATGLLDPGVMTLRQAADRLTADTRRLPLGPAARRALVGEVAARARGRDALGPLEALFETPGLVGYLASRFRALRREGVGPQQASAALRQAEGERVGPVLARLYRDYLAALERGRLLDVEGVLLEATERASAPGFTLGVLLIDLPLALAPIDEALVRALSASAQEITVSLPGPAEAAGPLAEVVERKAEAWRRLLQAAPDAISTVVAPVDAPAAAAGLRVVRQRLFTETEALCEDATGVDVLAGDNAQDAARRIARRVKRLLTTDCATPADVLIAAPRLDAAAPRYAEALREYGVPVAVDSAERLGSAGLVAASSDLLSVAESDWRFDDLLRLVGRTDLAELDRPSPSGRYPTLRAATEWFLRETGAPSGGRYVRQQADHLAEAESDEADHETSDTLRRLRDAARGASIALGRLHEAIDGLPEKATPLGWLDALAAALAMLGRTGFDGAADPTDRRAADALEEAAAATESLARWRGRSAPEHDLRGFLALLTGWASSLRLPRDASQEGGVRIVGVETAIGVPCRHLLVVEADESSFASGHAAGDADEATAADESMRLFHELVARPSDSLTLAYAAFDPKAQPLLPSPHVLDVEGLFVEGATRVGAPPPMAGVDAMREPRSQREWRLQAVARANEGDAAALGAYARRHGTALIDGLTAIDARARGDTFGPWEGVFAGEAARDAVAARFGPEHLWSPSQLELMGACPFKFFSTHLLRLTPPEELTLDTDARRRGSLAHDALASCLASIVRELPPGERLSDLPEAELTERLTDEIARLADAGKLPSHEAALAKIEARQATRWARLYAEQQRKYDGDKRWHETPLRPHLLEARFGPAKGSAEHDDPASTDEPFALKLPGGETIRLTGRIDRVDAATVGDQTVMVIVDYKTGARVGAKLDTFKAGQQLQPILYTLAAQQLFFDGDATPVAAGYWGLREQGFIAPRGLKLATVDDGVVEPTDLWLGAADAARRYAQELVHGVRGALFPMTHPDKDCGKTCDFRTVCRVAQARSVGKAPPTTEGESA